MRPKPCIFERMRESIRKRLMQAHLQGLVDIFRGEMIFYKLALPRSCCKHRAEAAVITVLEDGRECPVLDYIAVVVELPGGALVVPVWKVL